MNILEEMRQKPYYGNYRGQIKEVDQTNKNGLYKVKIYPFFADIETQYLPLAQSNLTINGKHISLDVDEWVWIFFEGGVVDYPIIFDKCNIKDNYPDDAKGTQPSWYSNITPNSQIGESTVSYSGSYNNIDSFDYGDDIHLEFDKSNKQFIIIVGENYYIIDANGDIHEKSKNKYINITQKMNAIAQSFKLLTTAADEISIDDSGKVKIKGGASQMAIYNAQTSLYALLNDILTAFSAQVQTGNLGLPITWSSNPQVVTGLIKLNQLLSSS